VIPGDPWSERLRKKLPKLLGSDLPATQGGCWILADAMADAWGGELGIVWGGVYEASSGDQAHHVYVELAPDVLVDGEGVHTAEEMAEKADGWEETYGVWLGPFDPFALMAVSTPPPFEGKRKKKLVKALRKLGPPTRVRRNPHDPLGLAGLEEYGAVFRTGQPVTFAFQRNTVSAPHGGGEFQQDLEPAGRFLVTDHDPSYPPLPGWEKGSVSFASPLVLWHSVDPPGSVSYDERSWKARLAGHYGATGAELSAALMADGYDGIVTVQLVRNQAYTGEIVDLGWGRERGWFNNPVEPRTGRRPLYRGVSPWEMQRVLDTGQVYGAGGADFREDCQTFFAEELEDAIHHGSMYWRYFVWHHPLFLEGKAPIERLRKIKHDLYEIQQGLAWPDPAYIRVAKVAEKVGGLLSKLEGRLSKAAWDASKTAFRRSGKLDADSYVIELAGVEGGMRYTGADNLGGQGFSEVCFPPGHPIPLKDARVHFVKDSAFTGAVRDPLAPDPWHRQHTGRDVFWKKVAIPKVSLRRLQQARDYVLKHQPKIEKLAHEAYALMSTEQNPVYGNPPSALQRVRRAIGRGRDCYPGAEVVYHANGGKRAGLTPMQQRHEGVSHWWVRGPGGEVLDPAAAQFRSPVPYERGRGRGFLTKRPSRRARQLARRAKVKLNSPDRRLRQLERAASMGDPYARSRLHRERIRATGLVPETHRIATGAVEGVLTPAGEVLCIKCTDWGKPSESYYVPRMANARCSRCGVAVHLPADPGQIAWGPTNAAAVAFQQLQNELRVVHGLKLDMVDSAGLILLGYPPDSSIVIAVHLEAIDGPRVRWYAEARLEEDYLDNAVADEFEGTLRETAPAIAAFFKRAIATL
jgi:hypothetical protein